MCYPYKRDDVPTYLGLVGGVEDDKGEVAGDRSPGGNDDSSVGVVVEVLVQEGEAYHVEGGRRVADPVGVVDD